MDAKDIIHLNNDKRKLLTKENEDFYSDMIVYIRTNANKSEQQTEEVLLELLDHLIEAQAQGKNAKDVFGDDLKAYCDEVIQEISGEKTSKNLSFISYLALDLIALIILLVGIGSYGLHIFLGIGSDAFTFPVGSALAITFIDLSLLALWIFVIFKWIKQSTFKKKKTNKWVEFLQLWIICSAFIGLSLIVFLWMPEFGATVSIQYPWIIGIGAILYVTKIILNKKYRLVK